MNISMMVTKNTINAIIEGKPYVVSSEDPKFQLILQAYRDGDEEKVKNLICSEKIFGEYTQGKYEIRNGKIFFQGEEVHNFVCERIIEFMRKGLPHEPLILFLERLMANPSYNSRQELYAFLEANGMPIDPEDGHFYAYKALNENFTDIHTGKIQNTIGSVVEMPRCDVDDNASRGCSRGLHAGNLDYVKSFGSNYSKYVIVKIDPADVVSVPNEDCRKLRTCRYKVASIFEGELTKVAYTEGEGEITPSFLNEEDVASKNAEWFIDDILGYDPSDDYDEDDSWYDD